MSTSLLPLKFKYLQIKQRIKAVLTKKSRFLSFVYLSLHSLALLTFDQISQVRCISTVKTNIASEPENIFLSDVSAFNSICKTILTAKYAKLTFSL